MNVKFVIPVMLPDVTDKCLATYDLPWQQLILVDNSKRSFCKKYEGRGADIRYHPENLGVPASWNIGMQSDADILFVVSSAAVFNQGFSEIMRNIDKADEYGLLTTLSWHCIGFTRKTINQVGLFDEQFYPAYYEDNDYGYRLQLNGIHNSAVHNLPKIELDAYDQGEALTLKSGRVNVKFDRLQKYYISKWGGLPGNEKYSTPFNQGVLNG